MTRDIYIGVDPSFRMGGFAIAILDENRELQFKVFHHFTHFISWVQNEAPKEAIVGIENSNLQDVTFSKYFKGNSSKQVVAKISRAVGKNMAASQLAVDLFTDYCSRVYEISPLEKGGKKPMYVVKALIQQNGYKWTPKKLDEDERDAFMIMEIAKTKHNFKVRTL